MLIERLPNWLRRQLPQAIFRMAPEEGTKKVYLTFDDGPIPEVTPQLLDLLDLYEIKGTFFMVGDNVRKYPELYREVLRRGHHVGNHTMHHIQGLKVSNDEYLRDVAEGAKYIESDLFRPPHGWLRQSQINALAKDYRIIMYDLVTRDYSKRLSAEDVFKNVKRYTRDGSIIVFHDSLKSENKLFDALPKSIEWLKTEGYQFGQL